MIPTCLNSSPSLFDPVESDDQQHQVLYTAKPQAFLSSSLSNNHHVFSYPIQDQQGCYHRELQHQLKYQPEVANNFASEVRSRNHLTLERKKIADGKDQNHQSDYKNGLPAYKLMPLKIRLKHDMMNTDPVGTEEALPNAQLIKFGDHQKQPSSPLETENSSNFSSTSNINTNNPIRVCSNCNTTKTPLWRSGPRGPKSLCNACGIRQRKARRAMAAASAAAAAASNGTILAAEATETLMVKTKAKHKEKRSKLNNGGHIAPQYKKRFKLGTISDHGTKKICFEELLMSLSKNLASHRVFPQDEKEAAILLMALSCGLAHG